MSPIKTGPGGFTHLSRVILAENPDSSMPAHMKGMKETYCSGPTVDPNFSILMPEPSVGWWRAWFLLRNDANTLLPVFLGGCPIPHPS
jgi:hypothetical protein